MIPSNVLQMMGIYQNHKVIATYPDGKTVSGILEGYDAGTGILQIDDASIGADELRDLEYFGTLGVDDYQTFHRVGEIDNVYKFTIGDLLSKDSLDVFLYHEFQCQVACHLCIQNGAILATDVRPVSTTYVANLEYLSAKPFLYRFNDGSYCSGRLNKEEDGSLTLCGAPFRPDLVSQVTKLPEINDNVSVIMKDGATHKGLVCATQADSFNIYSDALTEIPYEQVEQIRYVGVITSDISGRITIEKQYVSKLPYYLRNEADESLCKKGIPVSFIAGINSRGPIAKDVVLEEEAAAVKDPEYYGVLLTVDFSKENGVGYIGNRYVTKSCGKPETGRTRFLRSQMDFEIQYNKAYIIKYTYTDHPSRDLRIVNHMELVQVVDSSKLGIIEVSDAGEVNLIPLYKAGISRFENRDVDVVCAGGETYSGILQSHDEEGVTVVQGAGEAAKVYTVPFSQIQDILLIGTVTQFYQNGTGYVDNAFFFHINEMEQSVDAQFVRRGTQFIFTLKNARKGNFVDCGNIRVLHEKKLEVFVLGYQDKKYTVVDAERYGRGIHFFDKAYEVPYASFDQFRDLKHEDYRAIMTMQRKAGVLECTYIRALANHPKLHVGIVTNVDREHNTVSILPPEHYRKRSDATTYPLALRSGVERLSDPAEKDYKVLYSLSIQDREYAATISWVDQSKVYNKCFFGYLESYLEDRDCGFITPEAHFDQWPRPRNQGIYCRPAVFQDPPPVHELVDTKYVYRVCYTMDNQVSSKQHRPPAQNVWFLEKVERPQKPLTSSRPAPQVAAEDIDLRAEYPAEPGDEAGWHFGLVSAFSPLFSTFSVYQSFPGKRVLVNVPEVDGGFPLAGALSEKLDTTQFTYLVRFRAAAKGEGAPLEFDASQPLEFLREFRKSQLRTLSVQDGTLHIETLQPSSAPKSGPAPVKPAPAPAPEQKEAPPAAISFCPGETILIQQDDQTWSAGNVDTAEADRLVLTDGRTLRPAESSIIRFGVLTSFNDNLTIGQLNGRLSFSFANMESRTFNMIKNARKQQLLWYTCQDGKVSHVERIAESFLEKLPFQWQPGTVSDYEETNEKRCIFVDGDIRCLRTVSLGGGYISRLIKSDTLLGTAVFVKTIFCPYTKDGATSIRQYALDIHCEQELVLIRYDAVSDSYLAARNAAKSVSVEGNGNMLSSLVDSQAEVSYRVTEGGRSLQAYIDSGDDDADWSEGVPEEELDVSKALVDSSLVQYLLRKVDLNAMQLPDGVELSPDGWPANVEDSIRLILSFGEQPKGGLDIKKAIAMVALMERLPEERREEILSRPQYNSVEATLWKILNRQVRAIGREHDCLWGEYSYYETTILRNIRIMERQKEELYKFFLQDFYSRIEVMEKLRQMSMSIRGHRPPKVHLRDLFRRSVLTGCVDQLVAHMISLDEVAIQVLLQTEDVLAENPGLQGQILDWGRQVDNTQSFESADTLINHLRLLHRGDKSRFTRELADIARGPGILRNAERILLTISVRFLRLIAADDAKRFTTLLNVCQSVNANRSAGYLRYQAALKTAWSKCSELLKSAEQHLTQETTEMLLNTGLLEAVLAEIARELDGLYRNPDYMPDVRCTSNDSEVVSNQKNLILLVENGTAGRTNLQSAYGVKLHLEVLSGLAGDSIPETIVLRENVLPAGGATVVLDDIPLDLSSLDGDVFSISVSAEYDCCAGFREGEVKETQTQDCGILEFQIREEQNLVKNKDAVNYYAKPAEGNPLKESDSDECSMFFGRKEELAEIWNSLIDENQKFREGSAIMLYGQKKCGKTSLVNQIIGRMKTDPVISKQAIIISIRDILEFNGGVTGLANFSLNFYQNILDEFDEAIHLNNREVGALMDENGLEVPLLLTNPSMAAALFQRYFRRFSALDNGRHQVVLVMDEFTRLCTTILDQKDSNPEYQGIPNFIKLFSSMGFVQIVIGHPNMMVALSKLGIINHTAEFAKRIELSALKEDDARKLIRDPMFWSFGFDVYRTKLGERAVEKLLSLSGCHPSVLMKLCDQMFEHYITTLHSQILIHDVEKMLKKYLEQLEASTMFDILVHEDGDNSAFFESLPSYQYLKRVALESLHSNNRDCHIDLVCPELGEEASFAIRETLISRKVLVAGNGRIKIPMELFLEYIQYKYESR